MDRELENLEYAVKRKFSFRFKPQFTETFKTNISDGQIIPIAQEVFEKLDWPIVYLDKRSIEAKRKNSWGKLTAKITITKKGGGKIEVHSKSLEGHFTDLGKNSKRTGLFIAVFEKLRQEYEANDQLDQLEEEFNKQFNWENYKVPDTLPPPPEIKNPNLKLSLIGGVLIALMLGTIYSLFDYNVVSIGGIGEVLLGLAIGYLFGKVLVKANYTNYKIIKVMTIGVIALTFITSFCTEYLILNYSRSSFTNFFKYLEYWFAIRFNIEEIKIEWILFMALKAFLFWICYIIAIFKISELQLKLILRRIPPEVIDFTIYHLEKSSGLSQMRHHLAQKGWKRTIEQDAVFDAINENFNLQEMNRD